MALIQQIEQEADQFTTFTIPTIGSSTVVGTATIATTELDGTTSSDSYGGYRIKNATTMNGTNLKDDNRKQNNLLESAIEILQSLAPEYQCHICHNQLTETHVVTDCQHRFCKRCVIDNFHACPRCNTSTSSAGGLIVRKDPQLDKIVSQIYTFT